MDLHIIPPDSQDINESHKIKLSRQFISWEQASQHRDLYFILSDFPPRNFSINFFASTENSACPFWPENLACPFWPENSSQFFTFFFTTRSRIFTQK